MCGKLEANFKLLPMVSRQSIQLRSLRSTLVGRTAFPNSPILPKCLKFHLQRHVPSEIERSGECKGGITTIIAHIHDSKMKIILQKQKRRLL